MDYKCIFKRYELKYSVNGAQREALTRAMLGNGMRGDEYGKSNIMNIYYDTPDYRIARLSLDKPMYKEKLRLRGYGSIDKDKNVFVELKKKYDGVVYKRRVNMSYAQAQAYLDGGDCAVKESQVIREIDYFKSFYSPL